MKLNIKNDSGHTLVLVVIFLAVLGILAASMSNSSVTQRRSALNHARSMEAFYIARAGAESTKLYLEEVASLGGADAVDLYVSSNDNIEGSFGSNSFQVSVSEYSDNFIVLNSTGTTDFGASNSVELLVPFSGFGSGVMLDMALFAHGDIDLKGGGGKRNLNVSGGDVGAGGTISASGSISFDDDSKLYENLNTIYPSVLIPDFPSPTNLGDLVVNNNETVSIDYDAFYRSIDLKNNSNFIIDISSRDVNLVTDSFDNAGTIEVIGGDSGNRLNIFVKDSFSGGSINGINTANSTIYYTGDDKISIRGSDIVTNYYISQAEIDIRSGGSNYVTSNIFTNSEKITISSANFTFKGIIYAPHAEISATGGFDIEGAVVADTFTLGGSVTLTYYIPGDDEGDNGFVDIGVEPKVYDFSKSYWRRD